MNTLSVLYTLLLLITPLSSPQADDDFSKFKYDREAAKQARAAKRTERKTTKTGTSKKEKPSASDLFKLDDSSDDEEEVISNSLDSLSLPY